MLLWFVGGFGLWIVWCFYAVSDLTPWVMRHLTIWVGTAAWVLCMLPPLVVATVMFVRVSKAEQ